MPANELGRLLRHRRDLRGQSQLDRSLDTGISQRHLSFVESGRSVPSRELLLKVADALDVPLRDRNPLLLAAGYAPVYAEGAWDAAEMKTIATALRRMLRQHEPFLAVVLDRYWNVLLANEYTPRFSGRFVDLEARPKPRATCRISCSIRQECVLSSPTGPRWRQAWWSASAARQWEA